MCSRSPFWVQSYLHLPTCACDPSPEQRDGFSRMCPAAPLHPGLLHPTPHGLWAWGLPAFLVSIPSLWFSPPFPWAFRMPWALLDMALLLGRCSDLGPSEESLPVAFRLLPEDRHLPWPSGPPTEGPAQEG